MGNSSSNLAYTDCRSILERAMETPRGIRVSCPNKEAARMLQSRCNTARLYDRKLNGETYPEGHPMFRRSEWDRLTIALRGSDTEGWGLEIRKIGDLSDIKIEEL